MPSNINQSAVLSWNRLEARPRTKDLRRSLRAEVRDPLWFLSRQWQTGEFKGEDTGSCVEMRVDMETTEINRYSLRKRPALPYDINAIPIETVTERDAVNIDVHLSQEMGRHWEKLVRRHMNTSPAFTPGDIDMVIGAYRTAFQFTLPVQTSTEKYPEVYGDPAMLNLYGAISNGRRLNGGNLYTLMIPSQPAPYSTFSAAIKSRLDLARTDFLNWFKRVYSQPNTPADSAWSHEQLEYQVQTSAPTSSGTRAVLTADEYAQGHLDWYSFDFETNAANSDATLRNPGADGNLVKRRIVTVLPGDLRFPGMPLARWWEFEDFKVNLGNLVTDTTDVARLLQTEFALIYSNDWMLLPHEVPVGSISQVKSIVVRDVFGQYTSVTAAGAGDSTDWQRWSMFNLHRRSFTTGPADLRLFVPPAVIKTMEGEPLESVTFLRDEMANMVWGIEEIVPDGRGGSMKGVEAAKRVSDYLISLAPPPPPSTILPNSATIRYKLGNTVPENWIPFIPMRQGGAMSRQIQLRRAAMPRIIPGVPAERIRPRTELLRVGHSPTNPNWGPYFLFEEEVPRSGAIVNRTWQRARWVDGSVFTWLGRRKTNGRGEVNSGLEYDLILPKTV